MLQTLQSYLDERDPALHPEAHRSLKRVEAERQLREFKSVTMALLQTGCKAEEIQVGDLPGNICAITEGLCTTVDPVVFRDAEFTGKTFAHEKWHRILNVERIAKGVATEAEAELYAEHTTGVEAVPEHAEKVLKLKQVADVVGWKLTLDLFRGGFFTQIFQIFVSKSLKTGKTYPDCIRIFENAFPKLEIDRSALAN